MVTGQGLQLNAAGFGRLDATISSSQIIKGFGGQFPHGLFSKLFCGGFSVLVPGLLSFLWGLKIVSYCRHFFGSDFFQLHFLYRSICAVGVVYLQQSGFGRHIPFVGQ